MEDSYIESRNQQEIEFTSDIETVAQMRVDLEEARESFRSCMLSSKQLLEFGELLSKTVQRNPKLAQEVLDRLQKAIDVMGYDLKLPGVYTEGFDENDTPSSADHNTRTEASTAKRTAKVKQRI